MKVHTKQCEYCAKEFQTLRSDTKFCSGACKQGAYNQRVRLEILKAKEQPLQMKKEREERLDAIINSIDAKINQSQAVPPSLIETMRSDFEKTLNQLRQDAEDRKVNDANQRLKECLKQIFEYSEYEEISCRKILFLFEKIERQLGTRIYSLPDNYKFSGFINDTLFPCIAIWENEVNSYEERTTRFDLPKLVAAKFRDILMEIG